MGEAERILFNQVFRSRLFYGCRYIDIVHSDSIVVSRCSHINAGFELVVTFTNMSYCSSHDLCESTKITFISNCKL